MGCHSFSLWERAFTGLTLAMEQMLSLHQPCSLGGHLKSVAYMLCLGFPSFPASGHSLSLGLFSLQPGSQRCWGLHSPKVILNSKEQELMYKYPSFCSLGGDNLRGVPHSPSESPNGTKPQFSHSSHVATSLYFSPFLSLSSSPHCFLGITFQIKCFLPNASWSTFGRPKLRHPVGFLLVPLLGKKWS